MIEKMPMSREPRNPDDKDGDLGREVVAAPAEEEVSAKQAQSLLDLAHKLSQHLGDIAYSRDRVPSSPEDQFAELVESVVQAVEATAAEMTAQFGQHAEAAAPDNFIPSPELTQWITSAWIRDADDESGEAGNQIDWRRVAREVGEEIEGMFSVLAVRAESVGQTVVQISDCNRLCPEACSFLLNELDVDPHRFSLVSHGLASELDQYSSRHGDLRRPWGRIRLEREDDPGVFLLVDVDSLKSQTDSDLQNSPYWEST